MNKTTVTIALQLVLTALISAQLPQSDAYLITLFNNGKRVTTRDISYLSGMNPGGYNNQPAFANPNEVYLTTNLYDPQFTDIMKLDLLNNEYSFFTQTDSIGEYSPTPMTADGILTCVRVERDQTTQSLHQYPLSQENSGRRLARAISNVGYHQWMSETEVALVLVTVPTSLVLYDIENQTTKLISEDVGRCLKQDKFGKLLYVNKVREDLWYLKSYDAETEISEVVTQTLPGAEDFELLTDGTLLMGSGSSLYYHMPNINETWLEVVDLYEYGIENITRLAVSRNRLVLINNKEK